VATLSVSQTAEHGPDGRYGGALTSRPAPATDPSIAALSPKIRGQLAAVWLARAAMERRVADSFGVIRDALRARGAAPELVQMAHRAIDDEHRHAELSRVVASRYAGRELPPPERLPLEVPRLARASPATRDTLHIIGQCILNETTAAAYLELCMHHATGPTASWASRELLSDEVDHGRIGWAHVASLSPEARSDLSPWLLPLAYLNLRVWRKETIAENFEDPVFSEHGAPSAAAVEDALMTALRDLIIVGFAHLGLDVTELSAWVAAGAATDSPPTKYSRILRQA
jgi:hypothetical protein